MTLLTSLEYKRGVDDIKTSLLNTTGGGSSGSGVINKSFYNLSQPKLIKFPPVSVEGLPAVTGGVHPSVLYFPRGFGGHKFWMCYTPYPGVRNENPVIVVSNDGDTWTTPAGLTNPIAPPPPAPKYYSDTELVMVATNRMRAYWREYGAGTTSKLMFKESTDGINWGETVVCSLTDDRDPLSPCIITTGSKYTLWLGSSTSAAGTITRLTSTDGINFTEPTPCVTNFDGNGFAWHPMVWATITGYHCLAAIRNANKVETAWLMTDLYYGKSKDGINWVFDENPLVSRGEYGMKNYRVYRSCAVMVAGRYKLYVSGMGNESEQIHVFDADKVGDLAAW